MKKIVCLFLGMLMIGCTVQNDGNNNASTTSSSTITTAPVLTTITTTTVPEYNYPKPEYHDQIMNGDFSSIAGVYKNIDGNAYVLNEHGFRTDVKDNDIYIGMIDYDISGFEGFYLVSLNAVGQEGGAMLMIIPSGVPINGFETDITKIRIAYGQVFPQSIEEVYYKE